MVYTNQFLAQPIDPNDQSLVNSCTGADGKATLFIGALADITAHKEAELERNG